MLVCQGIQSSFNKMIDYLHCTKDPMTTRGEDEWNDYRITHKDPMTTQGENEWNDYRMINTRPDEMTPRIKLHCTTLMQQKIQQSADVLVN
jgi:hypothetical protein